jgi:hypothetical protein
MRGHPSSRGSAPSSRGSWACPLLAFRAAALVQRNRHDAVSIGLAAVDGTGVTPVASDGATFSLRLARRRIRHRSADGRHLADLPGLAAIWPAARLTGIPGLILAARRDETWRRGRT